MSSISEAKVQQDCRPGQRAATCRYLTMAAGGWCCAKHQKVARYLDARVEAKSIVARGDNCEGIR